MPVETRAPIFEKQARNIKKCRDVMRGEDALKAAGTAYLQKLKEQNDEDYQAYKDRPAFFNATSRTVNVLSALPFRKPVIVEDNSAIIDALKSNIDGLGTSISGLCEQVLDEIMVAGAVGVLVDMPVIPDGLTQAEVKKYQAKAILYKFEQLIDYRASVSETGQHQVCHVRLAETIQQQDSQDEFKTQEVNQIRVLDFAEGAYRVRLYQEYNGKYELKDTLYPKRQGKPLDFIPFYLFTPSDIGKVNKPPINDLVNINLGHYRLNADYYHGLHFSALPTAYIAGAHNDDNQTYYIGSTAAWVFSDPQAKVGFLEFTGQGLNAIKEALDDLKSDMAAQGARILAGEKRAAETAETTAIKHNGENSLLASYVAAINKGMTKLLQWAASWKEDIDIEAIKVEVSTDFLPHTIDANTAKALLDMYLSGSISQDTFLENMQRGEIINRSIEEEKELIEEANPLINSHTEDITDG